MSVTVAAGLPVAVKDLTPVKGLPFTQVSTRQQHPVPASRSVASTTYPLRVGMLS